MKKIPQIDPHNLDKECSLQSLLIDDAVAESSAAVSAFLEADLAMDNAKAVMELRVRKDFASYGLTKDTEGAIKAKVAELTQEESFRVMEAEKRKYAAIQYKEGVLARATELKNLINLYLNNYYVRQESVRCEENAAEIVAGMQEELHNEDLTTRLQNRAKEAASSIGEGAKRLIKRGQDGNADGT